MTVDLEALAHKNPVLVYGVAGGVLLGGAWFVLRGRSSSSKQTAPTPLILPSQSQAGTTFPSVPLPPLPPSYTDPCGGPLGFFNPQCNPTPAPNPPTPVDQCIIGYHHDETGHCVPDNPPTRCGPGSPNDQVCDPGPGPFPGPDPRNPDGPSGGLPSVRATAAARYYVGVSQAVVPMSMDYIGAPQ